MAIQWGQVLKLFLHLLDDIREGYFIDGHVDVV